MLPRLAVFFPIDCLFSMSCLVGTSEQNFALVRYCTVLVQLLLHLVQVDGQLISKAPLLRHYKLSVPLFTASPCCG